MSLVSLLSFTACGSTNDKLSQPSEIPELSIEHSEAIEQSIASEKSEKCIEISKEPKKQNDTEIKLTHNKICSMIKEESNGLKITMKVWANDLENREEILCLKRC